MASIIVFSKQIELEEGSHWQAAAQQHTEMSTATTSHQLGLAFALLPASLSLAALHANRSRILNPAESTILDSTHCSNCGFYLLTGDGSVRLVRPEKRRKSLQGQETSFTVMRRTCGSCGHRNDTKVDRCNALALFPKTRKHKIDKNIPVEIIQDAKEQHSISRMQTSTEPLLSPTYSSLAISSTSHPDPAPSMAQSQTPAPGRSKLRPKKKTGLQDMLSRNREKEERERKSKNSEQGSLATFLSEL